jgi:hypothetical protein
MIDVSWFINHQWYSCQLKIIIHHWEYHQHVSLHHLSSIILFVTDKSFSMINNTNSIFNHQWLLILLMIDDNDLWQMHNWYCCIELMLCKSCININLSSSVIMIGDWWLAFNYHLIIGHHEWKDTWSLGYDDWGFTSPMINAWLIFHDSSIINDQWY